LLCDRQDNGGLDGSGICAHRIQTSLSGQAAVDLKILIS
jgi:hypothetical protein